MKVSGDPETLPCLLCRLNMPSNKSIKQKFLVGKKFRGWHDLGDREGIV